MKMEFTKKELEIMSWALDTRIQQICAQNIEDNDPAMREKAEILFGILERING